MNTQYKTHSLELIYQLDREKWIYWIDVIVDSEHKLTSERFVIPRELRIFSWIIEDIPAYIESDLPNLTIRWGGYAIGLNVKDRIDILPVLNYLNLPKE